MPLPTSTSDSKYISLPHTGTVSFDYSNNNGCYAIGEGLYLFETKWSKASKTSIHVYNDPFSIDLIAIAKGLIDIDVVQDIDSYDFSSRARTAKLGQVIIFKNKNGFSALAKVINIKDDSRGDEQDEVIFEYKIFT